MRSKLSSWIVKAGIVLLPVCLAAQTNCNEGAGALREDQPQGIAVNDIIQKFSAHENEFQEAQTHYSYTMEVSIKSLAGTVTDGEFRRISQISYNQGKRTEEVVFAPQSTLTRLTLTKQDYEDMERSPFVLTREGLPLYKVTYAGQQKVDLIETYVFDVAPKQMEKGKRYFQGRVWVEIHELALVKSCGKNVPDEVAKGKKKKDNHENVAPTQVSYREQFEHKYWFPTYARSDENLHFRLGDDVHLREVIKYTKYQRADSSAGAVSSARP
jgi:hypothetical protein